MIVAPGGVAALATGPRKAAGPRSIVASRSVILRTVCGEIRCPDSDNHWAGSLCVTCYMECSARGYSRTSIISDSDISPSNTVGLLNQVRSSRKKFLRVVSASDGRNNPTPTVARQAREETTPSFDPQFLQNRASAGLAVLQFSHILGPCMVSARGVVSGHGRTGFSSGLVSRVLCASTEP